MTRSPLLLLLWTGLAAGMLAACDNVTRTTGKDEQSFLPYWQIEDGSMSLRLAQRLPDQTRGLYMRFGFSEAQAEEIALSCAFQTVFRNTSNTGRPSPLRFNLTEWEVMASDGAGALVVRENWEARWRDAGVDEGPRRNMEWSLLPTEIQYEPGDYNWGLSFYGLKPGSRFDLRVVWHQHGERRDYVIRGLECAPDIHPDPEEFRRQNQQ